MLILHVNLYFYFSLNYISLRFIYVPLTIIYSDFCIIFHLANLLLVFSPYIYLQIDICVVPAYRSYSVRSYMCLFMYTCKSSIARFGGHVFNITRQCLTLFQSDYINLYLHSNVNVNVYTLSTPGNVRFLSFVCELTYHYGLDVLFPDNQ